MSLQILNRSATYHFQIIDTYIAGMVLQGSEVKAIRENKINFNDAYCFFHKGELWIKNLHISEYSYATIEKHKPTRDRKLLLQKRQLIKIAKQQKEKGYSIIPLSIFEQKRFLKIKIALAKGKKSYDKRESLKKKDLEKQIRHSLYD